MGRYLTLPRPHFLVDISLEFLGSEGSRDPAPTMWDPEKPRVTTVEGEAKPW